MHSFHGSIRHQQSYQRNRGIIGIINSSVNLSMNSNGGGPEGHEGWQVEGARGMGGRGGMRDGRLSGEWDG